MSLARWGGGGDWAWGGPHPCGQSGHPPDPTRGHSCSASSRGPAGPGRGRGGLVASVGAPRPRGGAPAPETRSAWMRRHSWQTRTWVQGVGARGRAPPGGPGSSRRRWGPPCALPASPPAPAEYSLPLLSLISRTARSDSRARLGPPGRRRRRERDVLRQDTACRSSCSISWHTDTCGRPAGITGPRSPRRRPLPAPLPPLLSPSHFFFSPLMLFRLSPCLFLYPLSSHSLPFRFLYLPVLFQSHLSTSQLLSYLRSVWD